MEMRDYIEKGIAKCGTAVSLAKVLDQLPTVVRNAKSHQRGLPVYACIKLAELLEVEPMEVISASELVTEKNEKRKAIFLPFVQAARHAQHLTIALVAGVIAFSLEAVNSITTFSNYLLKRRLSASVV